MEHTQAVIFDLEGVLIDNRSRLKYALLKVGAQSIGELSYPKKGVFWRIFLDRDLASQLDKVNRLGIRVLAERMDKSIIIVSGSPCTIVRDHIEKIKACSKELGIPIRIDEVYCRKKTRKKAPDMKEEVVKSILARGVEVVEAHDDDERVLARLKKYGIKCILWRDLRPIGTL